MQTTYKLPSALQSDLEKLRVETERLQSGETSAARYRSLRVPHGVYEQRQDGTYMLRVRLPAGVVYPHQLRKFADVARKYGNARLHATTRQDIQIHDVPLDGICPALTELANAGLSARGGGGNTVRNIMACPGAGVCSLEVFDVSPCATALTEFLLSDPLSLELPRKYKIGFSGCSEDCIGATVNDVGFIAKNSATGPGFSVYAGGGMGANSRVAQLLEEFVPAHEAHLVAEAIKRVFDKHGNRKDKNRARLRYLVEEKGFDRFKRLYHDELAGLRSENPATPGEGEIPRRSTPAWIGPSEPGAGFAAWRRRHVTEQRQSGYTIVNVPLFLGDVSADTLEDLADVIGLCGEGMVRVTSSQNLVIRWVPEAALPALHHELDAIGLANPPGTGSHMLRETIACTGADTCRLGVCLSQGLTRAICDTLECAGLTLPETKNLTMHLNGCPNSCGRHPIGPIALHGVARRIDGRAVPHYVLELGGRVGEGRTRLAENVDTLPARNIPSFMVEFLQTFHVSPQYPDFDTFLDEGGKEIAKRIAARHKIVPPFDEDPSYYYDWGANEPFSLAGRGPGECGAGVFDLIKVDLATARQARDEQRLAEAVQSAARALLVTRGEEAEDSADACRLFEKHFLDAGLVDESFRDLLVGAGEHADRSLHEDAFEADPDHVSALIAVIEVLYENMDQSLRFQPEKPNHGEAESVGPEVVAGPERAAETEAVAIIEDCTPDREVDLQGVSCPLNYVKAKLLLGQMSEGQTLSLLLDAKGGRSVPESVEKDGHKVVSRARYNGTWQVVIRRG